MTIATHDTEVIATAYQWLQEGHAIRLVTVARTWGSSPRPPGSMAVVRADGALAGSVSGGCVEKHLSETFGSRDERVVTHHIDDEQAQRFGLSCGGQLELVFESLQDPQQLQSLHDALQKRQRIWRHLELDTGSARLEDASGEDPAATAVDYADNRLSKLFGPVKRLLLIGAGQLSRYTAEFAMALDYEVMVCEPRAHFRTAWSVPGTSLLDELPDDAVTRHASDAHAAVLALTHDPNLDDMALMEALPSAAFYVGALGSLRNYELRRKRLLALGVEPEAIERLHGPIGLDIGSRTSAEIAISIVAELIQVQRRPRQAANKS